MRVDLVPWDIVILIVMGLLFTATYITYVVFGQ